MTTYTEELAIIQAKELGVKESIARNIYNQSINSYDFEENLLKYAAVVNSTPYKIRKEKIIDDWSDEYF